ncbi:secreted frizzled-related protein 2 [Talpa occidentalis]|nr:secreted frizzled-related protein 2 [Talpa occidentalis]
MRDILNGKPDLKGSDQPSSSYSPQAPPLSAPPPDLHKKGPENSGWAPAAAHSAPPGRSPRSCARVCGAKPSKGRLACAVLPARRVSTLLRPLQAAPPSRASGPGTSSGPQPPLGSRLRSLCPPGGRAPMMPRGPGSLLLLVLASHCCLGSARGLFFGQPDFSYKRSNCKPIPANLQLCHGIEYQNMRLPNLLGHETMKEVLEQAGAWIPLVMKQCHPDTKKFLCSLFAPVCLDDLDETIQPCHSLCVQVKDRCAPVMSAFGFPWPDMLECDRFPQDNDLCIPLASSDHLLPATEEAPKVCEACKNKNEDDNDIMETLCKNDFALKIKVKEITYINRDTKIILETKSKTIYKLNGVSERDLKKSVLWLKDSLQCTCEEMNDINAPYLVMGQKLGGELVITSVKRWQKGQREFKRISRSIRKLQC